jgi:hypothetical protein
MDRVIVYDGALPQTTDVLQTNKFTMVDQAYQNRAIVGVNTAVSGLACTPTSPTADLHVTVGVGSIFQSLSADSTAYGDLGTDIAIPIIKQGINAAPVVLTITPPGTPGQSQVYLVQAIASDVDAGSTVLSYYNSSNPAAPYSGPANSGASNFTIRTCPCSIALVAGTPATTGTQVTPPPQAGYVGLYAVTVANGQTQITAGNIVNYPLALFIPPLTTVPNQVQAGAWVYCADTGAINALVVTPTPNIAALTVGLGLRVKVLVSNNAASTITINYTNASGTASTYGPIAIKRGSTAALASGDLISGAIIDIIYDGTNFQMMNYIGSTGSNTSNVTQVGLPYIADTGTQNALIATFSPSIGSYAAGVCVAVKLANTITGACTINANGLGVKAVKLGDLTNPPYNVFVAGQVLVLEYDGTQFQIVNVTSGMFYRRPTANYLIYVNTSTGDDTLYDGTSASVVGGSSTAGPLKTIQKAVNTAFGYAPSQFTITISIAAGTYNEAISTPTYAGPNLIIDGNVMANVIINTTGATCIGVTGPNTVNVTRLTYQNTGSSSTAHGIVADGGARVNVTGCASNGIAGNVFLGNNGGIIIPTSHTFNGSCNSLFAGFVNGIVKIGGTYTFASPISVSASCTASQGGQVDGGFTAGTLTFTNAGFVSGLKFAVALNGTVVAVSAGGAAVGLPGTSFTQATGGQYA